MSGDTDNRQDREDGHERRCDNDRSEGVISEKIKRLHDDLQIPDGKLSWERMQGRLQTDYRKTGWLKKLKLGTAVVMCSLLIGLSLNGGQPTSAFTRLFSTIRHIQDGFVHVDYRSGEPLDTSGAKTPPPPDYDAQEGEPLNSVRELMDLKGSEEASGVVTTEKVTLEQARKKMNFEVLVPEYIPEGFALDQVELFKGSEGKYKTVHITYKNSADDICSIIEEQLQPGSVGGSTIFQKVEKVVDVNVNGDPAMLALYSRGGGSIEWIYQDKIRIRAWGKLNEEQFIRLAQSMKKAKDG